jgi:hypothetical protein
MDWKRNGSVHASGQYVIEPATETFGVVRYRLTGGGLDELSRDVPKLKELAESHAKRQLVVAAEQRRRDLELAKARSSVEHRLTEIREHVEEVLPPDEKECEPDWSELTAAEAEDRRRREAAELFEQRQAMARRAADDTEARQRAIIARAEAALARTDR